MSLNVNEILGELTKDRKDRVGVSATTLNLVAFVEDAALLGWLKERIDAIAQKHPSRTLVLDATHTDSTHAVHTEAKDVGDTLSTHAEAIELGVAGVSAESLASIVRALTVPNVQTVLCWAGSHLAGDMRFRQLTSIANSLVLDSSRVDATAQTLYELTDWMAGGHHPAVRDLAYMRLGPWQDMIAQFFDEADLAGELASISRVTVAAGSQAEAYYLVGWLASRLQWHARGAAEFCNSQGQIIAVAFEEQGGARRVRRIALESGHSTFTAELQKDSPDLVCLRVEGKKARPQRCAPLHDIDVVSLIEEAILVPDGGNLFRESLATARALLEERGSSS
ncbi:MAG TPA: glucose-6-phosphate dehydrogenase assembly protein OpcA [Candidatus Baltobacteraceae bacterium]|jgi:glucose-6-phosphate dehydrogenase assembly protein OpcA